MEFFKSSLLVLLILLAITENLNVSARSLKKLTSEEITKSHTISTESTPELEDTKSTATEISTPQKTECSGPLCNVARSYASSANSLMQPTEEKILIRNKRGDVDVKLAEYMQWWKIHGRPLNCANVGCDMIQIINSGRRKRSVTSRSENKNLL